MEGHGDELLFVRLQVPDQPSLLAEASCDRSGVLDLFPRRHALRNRPFVDAAQLIPIVYKYLRIDLGDVGILVYFVRFDPAPEIVDRQSIDLWNLEDATRSVVDHEDADARRVRNLEFPADFFVEIVERSI